VIDCHTDTFHSRKWGWARPIHRWLLRRATAALVHTDEARELVACWGAPALLLPDDLPAPADAHPPRSAWNGPTVLIAGSLDANEPVAESVSMAALLPDVQFRLTGDASQLPASLTAGAPPNAIFTGYLPYRRFLGEMLAADVVAVFSTDPHIMNRAAFEAVGLGCPLVLSDLRGLRDRFGAGARFAANRPEAMATAIREALAQRAELAASSRELAQDLIEQRERAMDQLRRMLAEPARSPRPHRVLLLTQHPFPRNPMVGRAVSELLRQELEVDLICSAPPSGSSEVPPTPGLRIYRVPLRHRRRPAIRYPLEYAAFFAAALGIATWLGLRRRYVTVQVDNLPDVLVFAAAVPRWRGARLVFNMYELTPEMVAARFRGRLGRALVSLTRLVERAAVRWADHVIVVSRPCFDVLQARGVAAERMSVVLNTNSEVVVAQSHQARNGTPNLITHGTLVERYGVDLVIRAMGILRSSRPDVSLRVVGAGHQREALERLTHSLGLADRVTFTGYLPWTDTLAEVQRATLGVVAVLPDGYGQLLLPTKLLEYARLGVPAICSRLPAIEAYFPTDSLGYFQPGDEQDLAAQILRLLRDPKLARWQAARAQEVARGMAWDHVRFDYLRALGLNGERVQMA
jgi:glycosyltransferase involved in cell wall biosynthesis